MCKPLPNASQLDPQRLPCFASILIEHTLDLFWIVRLRERELQQNAGFLCSEVVAWNHAGFFARVGFERAARAGAWGGNDNDTLLSSLVRA